MRLKLVGVVIAAGLSLSACGVGAKEVASVPVDRDGHASLHALEGSANAWDYWLSRTEATFIEGRITRTAIVLGRDDPNRPSPDSFDFRGASSEEQAAQIKANDDTPSIHWEVTVEARARGPEASPMDNTIHMRRPVTEDEFSAYRTTGEIPERFAELKDGVRTAFAVLVDKYRMRGANASKHAFYTLLGWKVVGRS